MAGGRGRAPVPELKLAGLGRGGGALALPVNGPLTAGAPPAPPYIKLSRQEHTLRFAPGIPGIPRQSEVLCVKSTRKEQTLLLAWPSQVKSDLLKFY